MTGAQRTALYRKRHPEKVAEYLNTAHARELRTMAMRRWRARNPKPKKSLPPRIADLSVEQQRAITAASTRKWKAKKDGFAHCADYPIKPADGLCQNCGAEARLVLDHCHQTGEFRGWICDPCNVGIGQLGDDIEGLERALAYLKRGGRHG
jgi:Recombination endonuclease VII